MTTPRQRDTTEPVLDLARRLAEEFDTVPLPAVGRVVRAAAEAATALGADLLATLPTIERVARRDLAALRDAATPDAMAARP